MLFYLFGAVAIVASLLVIAQRNPIYSVLLLIASFGALSGLYVLLDAPFVAVIQIIVYAGAIMVLFLFVVMLLNAPHEDTEEDLETPGGAAALAGAGVRRFGGLLAVALIVELWWALTKNGGESGAFPGRRRGVGGRDRPAAVHRLRVSVRGHLDPDSRGDGRRGGAGPSRAVTRAAAGSRPPTSHDADA